MFKDVYLKNKSYLLFIRIIEFKNVIDYKKIL